MSIASPQPAPPVPRWREYHRVTRTALYGFVSVLPLLVLYEALILLANRGQAAQVRISAEIWLKRL
ncbi:MAG: CPBP family intramembrane glutamate endopeptidase, partial [Rhodothermales bacterium]|nr:CPBP family intramembrane glutamate endopeptidase [Rhodothermales bacterium]